MKVKRDSGFGYTLAYPTKGSIKLLFTIKKGNDRVILLEYLPLGPFRRVLSSDIHTLEPRSRQFVESLSATIDSGICDTIDPKHIDLYKDMATD